jgi:D-3-phosphoglycerate dehydrogenase
MNKCKKLKLICKHGAGLDNINLENAKKLGIAVCNVPGTNSNAVADLTIGLALAVTRNIVLANNNVRDGKWKPIIGEDLCFKTLGLLGFGSISQKVAKRAKGFSMNVIVYDPYINELPEEFKDFVVLSDLDKVIESSDILSLHLPLTDETNNMISAKDLKKMKKGAYIINTARGGIINEIELYNALVSGHISGAALDVSAKEPMEDDNPLRELENVIITPHIGMYSKEAIGAVSIVCSQNVVALFNNEELKFRVV